MSLDISLTYKDEEIMEMNWLRNPFGLCNWAEDVIKEKGLKTKKSLWHVINHWNYEKSEKVNRKLFLEIVEEYNKIIQELEEGHFYFNVFSLCQFVMPKYSQFEQEKGFCNTRIKGIKYGKDKVGIPMTSLNCEIFNVGKGELKDYKKWMNELLEFAKLLQNKKYKFYCSN